MVGCGWFTGMKIANLINDKQFSVTPGFFLTGGWKPTHPRILPPPPRPQGGARTEKNPGRRTYTAKISPGGKFRPFSEWRNFPCEILPSRSPPPPPVCCAVPCYAVLCIAVLCVAVLCSAVLCCVVLSCAVLCCVVYCCAVCCCAV